nr:MAG TPA: hypothetical protein [Caudoviricetes sp.]
MRSDERQQMLLASANLESRADDAYMEHEDVAMTPGAIVARLDHLKTAAKQGER